MSAGSQMPERPEGPEVPPGTIADRRPRARGALPRGAQIWMMLGLAAALLGIILVTGNPTPTERPQRPPAPTTPVDTQRISGYREQLEQRQQELARQLAQVERETAVPSEPSQGGNVTGSPPSDPIVEERKRRDYQSLFASNIALTRRADANMSSPAPASIPGDPNRDPELQTLDTRARESLARLNASVSALERAATTQAASASPSGRATSTPASIPPVAPLPAGEKPSTPTYTPPIKPAGSTHRVTEGTVLETVLATRLDGDFAGPVICQVSTPLYSHYGDAVLVPAGSKVLGHAKAVQTWGQRRLAVSFHRLVLPNGATYSLDQFTGLNQIGDTGLRDRVNQHYLSTFGAAAAIGLVSGFAQYLSTGALLGDGGGDRTVVITGAGADSTAQATAQILNRYTNRLPSITIREGHRVKVYLTQDLELPPYGDDGGELTRRIGGS